MYIVPVHVYEKNGVLRFRPPGSAGEFCSVRWMPDAGLSKEILDKPRRRTKMKLSMQSPLFARLKAALFACLLAMPVAVIGQNNFSPGGSDYYIAGQLPGDQTWPQAAVTTGGGYLVWQDNAIDTNGLGIAAEALNGNLTSAGSRFRVNVRQIGDQEKPAVALLPGGGAVFVWQGGTFGFQKIYARFLAANGSFLTSTDILVNTYTNEFQINPSVATLADGTVVVIWASYGEDGDMQGIFGQRFSAAGAKLGGEFQINQWTYRNQRTPAVAALANTNFVVVWISELQRGSASVDVYARLFDSSGVALGGEFPVNTSATNLCADPSVAASPQGGFAVAWGQKDGIIRAVQNQSTGFPATQRSTNSWDVFGRLYNSGGTAVSSPIRLNTYTYGDQYAPRIQAFGKNYLAVWQSLAQDGSREGMFGQFLMNDGSLEGVEFQVNTTSVSRQISATVATDGMNRFLAVWSSFVVNNANFDLLARAYDLITVQMNQTAQGLNLSWNTQPGYSYQVQVSARRKDLGQHRSVTSRHGIN